ncbi:MAG TPA: NifB/NifX family molybdenum-iron cluster-binding protein [Candidatus Omnitrophota bacterium]|nr:NifB/NifX family molybdenum-iron cluster-binding protein [Candidatus Omnitrophota bacterium]
MRIGITLEDDRGMEGEVAQHFGQCRYFFLADVQDNKITGTNVVLNNAQHGGGGCQAVDEMLRHKVDYVIAGGMGGGAQQKFARAGVKVFGYSGKVRDALDDFLKGPLGGLDACKGEHGHADGCH